MQKVRYRLSFNRLYIKFQDLFHFSTMITFNLSFTLLFTIDVRCLSLGIWLSRVQSNNYILRRTHRSIIFFLFEQQLAEKGVRVSSLQYN